MDVFFLQNKTPVVRFYFVMVLVFKETLHKYLTDIKVSFCLLTNGVGLIKLQFQKPASPV